MNCFITFFKTEVFIIVIAGYTKTNDTFIVKCDLVIAKIDHK